MALKDRVREAREGAGLGVNVLVSPLRGILRADALRFGVAEGPRFIALEQTALHGSDQPVVEPGAALADREPEAHDGVTVRPCDALRCPDRGAVYEARRDPS